MRKSGVSFKHGSLKNPFYTLSEAINSIDKSDHKNKTVYVMVPHSVPYKVTVIMKNRFIEWLKNIFKQRR